MSGFTLGPKTFAWMTSRLQFAADSLADTDNWEFVSSLSGNNDIAYYQSKLDLRAYNQDPGTALALVNVAIQESGPFAMSSTDMVNNSPACVMVDLISSVRIPKERMQAMALDTLGQQLRLPGFLHHGIGGQDWDDPANREYNTSQIIYGMWRFMVTNMNAVVGNRIPQGHTISSGEFGSGEVITAPHAYYYRICIIHSDAHTIQIPPANCSVHAQTVDLPEFVELAQMARLGQR